MPPLMTTTPKPSPEEQFYAYMTKLGTPKKGELRRVFNQLVAPLEKRIEELEEEVENLSYELEGC